MSPKEKTLLTKINQGLPKAFRKRYYALVEKREAETLTKKEYRELLRLTDEVERLQVDRVKMMVMLSPPQLHFGPAYGRIADQTALA